MPDSSAPPKPSPAWPSTTWCVVWVATLTALACALHGPGIGRPFGIAEPNPGAYFIPFVHNLELHGFWTLRGTPVGERELAVLEAGVPYLAHPPGLTWLYFVLGGSETAVRASSALATLLLALGTATAAFRALAKSFREAHASAAGLVAGTTTLIVPMFSIYAVGSYEPFLMAFGVWAFLAIDTWRQRGGRIWIAILVACCVAGPWIDWLFAPFCLGLVVMSYDARSLGGSAVRLGTAAVATLVSVGLIVVWLTWAKNTPGLPAPPPSEAGGGLMNLIRGVILAGRPDLETWLAGTRSMTAHGFTTVTCIVGIAGLPFAAWHSPRWALATATGVLIPIAFAKHALNHEFYHASLTPLLALSIATLIAYAARWGAGRWIPCAVIAAGTLAAPAIETIRLRRITASDFQRHLGETLADATGDLETPEYNVVHSWIAYFGAYLRAPQGYVFLFPARDFEQAKVISTIPSKPGERGIRYLWLHVESTEPGYPLPPQLRDPPGFAEFLRSQPHVRVPELEREHYISVEGPPVRITEALLVTLRESKV